MVPPSPLRRAVALIAVGYLDGVGIADRPCKPFHQLRPKMFAVEISDVDSLGMHHCITQPVGSHIDLRHHASCVAENLQRPPPALTPTVASCPDRWSIADGNGANTQLLPGPSPTDKGYPALNHRPPSAGFSAARRTVRPFRDGLRDDDGMNGLRSALLVVLVVAAATLSAFGSSSTSSSSPTSTTATSTTAGSGNGVAAAKQKCLDATKRSRTQAAGSDRGTPLQSDHHEQHEDVNNALSKAEAGLPHRGSEDPNHVAQAGSKHAMQQDRGDSRAVDCGRRDVVFGWGARRGP